MKEDLKQKSSELRNQQKTIGNLESKLKKVEEMSTTPKKGDKLETQETIKKQSKSNTELKAQKEFLQDDIKNVMVLLC